MMHPIDFVSVDLQYELTHLQSACIVGGPMLLKKKKTWSIKQSNYFYDRIQPEFYMNVDDTRQRVLGIGSSLDRDAEYRFRLLHRYVKISSMVRYYVWWLILALLQRRAVLVHR